MTTSVKVPAGGITSVIPQIKSRKDVYQIVTDRVLALMEKGKLNWKKGWVLGKNGSLNSVIPRNYTSGKAYRGINLLLLPWDCPSPYWLTYRQAKEQGGYVKAGEKGSPIVFFKPIMEEKTLNDGTKKLVQVSAVLRYYMVWNLSQCEGVPVKDAPTPTTEPEKIPTPESLATKIRAIMKPVTYGNPAYSPRSDEIHMPPLADFTHAEEYYSSFYHETVHWTGHPTRCNRQGIARYLEGKNATFGDKEYSLEELVAELGASFLNAMVGIEGATEENCAAYVQGWAAKMREDPKLIVKAAGQAQTAVDWVISHIEQEGDKDATEVV